MDAASQTGGTPAARKVLSREALSAARERARAQGRRVVQCHGCFDIVHPGHIRHLRFARAQGDVLLVSITPDALVGKGAGRPLIPQELRAENLAELDCVDWVHVAGEATAVELLEAVRPDVYIKGQEYESNRDPRFGDERATVERHGGRVVFSSGDVVFSSTALIGALESSFDPVHGRLSQLLGEPNLSGERLDGVLGDMRGRRIVVVGESIADTYVFCDRPGVAGESPIMTLRPAEHRHYDGGAAVIARHAAALGARPVLVTAMGDDEASERMRHRLGAEGVEVRGVAMRARLPEKQRFLVGAQKVMKVDLVDPIALDAGAQDRLIAEAVEAAGAGGCDAAILADFGLGLLTPAVTQRLSAALRPVAGVLAGDVSGRRSSLAEMRGLDLVCPSEGELRDAIGAHGEGLPAAVWRLLDETGVRSAIVTLGAEGLIAFGRLEAGGDGSGWQRRVRGEHVPALTPHAVDELGCGDALLASATLALASGASLLAAGLIGAAAASVEARRLGNIPVGTTEQRREIGRQHRTRLAEEAPEDREHHTAPMPGEPGLRAWDEPERVAS